MASLRDTPYASTLCNNESIASFEGDARSKPCDLPISRKRPAPSSSTVSNKGMRHISMRVMSKVEEKYKTTYNEVADAVAEEYAELNELAPAELDYESKSTRRRVYDILNVFVHIGIVEIVDKLQKEIIWKGLPTNAAHDISQLQCKRRALIAANEFRKWNFQDLILQRVSLHNLVELNKARTQHTTGNAIAPSAKINMPFIVVNTAKDAVVECELSSGGGVFLNSSGSFAIHDDFWILQQLRRMNLLQSISHDELRHMIPGIRHAHLPSGELKKKLR